VVIFDPSTGTKANKTIDLSAFDAYAGTDSAAPYPYMTKALYYNGKVYVACQRLHAPAGGYIQAADTSCIVVINAMSDSVEGAIKLVYKNPQELSICNAKLYVASLGKYGINDGGIECVDLATGTNTGTIMDENAMQGDVGSIIVICETKGYVVISTPAFATEMWAFNPQTKSLGLKISGIDSPCTNHFAYDGTYVYAGDRSTTTPGIVVVDPAADTKVGVTKNVGLPPNSLAYLEIK
jgi:DNA-binding beta-propeller fold protein YncE